MKRSILRLLLLLTLSLAGMGCDAQRYLDEAKTAIDKSNDDYFAAFEKGDALLFARNYTPDCWIMAANRPTLCGEEAPIDFFRSAYEQGLRYGKFISIDVWGDGKEFVTETGFYHFYDAKKALMQRGKYLVLWKKTFDGWRMFRNSFSPDHPTN